MQKYIDFTVSGNNVVFNVAPALGAKIVVPGIGYLLAGIVFDQNDVPGLVNPRILEVPFWLGNADEPDLYYWAVPPAQAGILIFPSDQVGGGVGAQPSWFQLAPALANGNAGTYGASGATINTTAISGADNIGLTISSGATSLTVTTSANFVAGDYIKVGSGTANVEIVKITAIPDATHLTVETTQNPHNINETIFTCGRKFWLKITIPLNATSGQAKSLYNIGIGKTYVITSRL